MNRNTITSVYFSATNTTRRIMKQLTGELEGDLKTYNITRTMPEEDIVMSRSDLLVVGMPVYAGRIPPIALPALHRFKGDKTPAVITVVYGNRDYDDALLELKDLVEANGFRVVAAAAFVAQHSIFPEVGAGRPDARDLEQVTAFARKSRERIDSIIDIDQLQELIVKGNRPYKVPGNIPLHPHASRKCTACGACVKQCPTQAISADSPHKTNKESCISCGRCIVICPEGARHFGGLLYKVARKKFVKAYSGYKEPEII